MCACTFDLTGKPLGAFPAFCRKAQNVRELTGG